MRIRCQWWVAALLAAGCGGTPGDRSAGHPTDSAAVVASEPARDTVGTGALGTTPAALPDRMSATAARRFLAAHPEALVLDVRNPDEWTDDLGHIDRARQIPLPELSAREGEIAAWKDKPIVVVCRAGGRSREATEMLRGAGFSQAVNLEGGMLAWRSSEKVAGQGH